MRTLTKVSARLIAAVLAVASLATVAQAQNQSFVASVKVPFAFETASGQYFQPGVYTITHHRHANHAHSRRNQHRGWP